MHGFGICIHRYWSKLNILMWKPVAWLITFFFVHVAWFFFRAENIGDALAILRAMFQPNSPSVANFSFPVINISLFILVPGIVFAFYEGFYENSMVLLSKVNLKISWSFIIFTFLSIGTMVMLNTPVSEFLYFQF